MKVISNSHLKRIRIVFLSSCFAFFCSFCSAQDFTDRGYWSELRHDTFLPVDSLWLFHPGSDLPVMDSNHTGWQIANTELLQNINGKPLVMQGAGWFQKKFDVPLAFRNKPVLLSTRHFGASDIFLDSRLIQRYGVVGNSMENEKIYVPRKPVLIYFDSQPSHTLLVHYSNVHANNPGYVNKHTGFRLFISPSVIASQSVTENLRVLTAAISILLIFCIYFFFVWIFYPKRLASLFTALWLLNFCGALCTVYLSFTQNEWEALTRVSNIGAITSVWLNFLLLFVLYALYYKGKMPRRTWLVVAAMMICVFAVLNNHFAFLLGIVSILAYVEIARVFYMGIRDKVTGFWILIIGFLFQQAGFFFIVVDVFNWFPVYTPKLLLAQMIFPQLGIPLTYSLHLAWEFRSANRDLGLQLLHVKELSQKNLEQEQEKQQLLALQNETLEKQVSERTAALTASLTELKSTQVQLIQSEKMASLGELTAGIAHEIQNPLNFVNNFSEVNKELIDEMQQEMEKGNMDDAKAIANDIKDNEDKINHHGRRADAIVKGMLQHSRSNSGAKESTDINALCDEYLRLSYHGIRAKDKSFNAATRTEFDESLKNIAVVPQEIGRVILNLINNAFYAVDEKRKLAIAGYEPTVSVSTKKVNDKVEISVHDNGNGIPGKVLDKIFQPFFTTKPTGQGTGLGLSMAYDIIKAHGGEIKVETKEGEGTVFTIHLPV